MAGQRALQCDRDCEDKFLLFLFLEHVATPCHCGLQEEYPIGTWACRSVRICFNPCVEKLGVLGADVPSKSPLGGISLAAHPAYFPVHVYHGLESLSCYYIPFRIEDPMELLKGREEQQSPAGYAFFTSNNVKSRSQHQLQVPQQPQDMQPSKLWAQRQRQPSKCCVLTHSTHPKEMSNSDGKANGQGGGSQVVLPALIGGSEDAQDQLEGEEELDGHRLPRRRLVMQLEGEEKHLRDRQVW